MAGGTGGRAVFAFKFAPEKVVLGICESGCAEEVELERHGRAPYKRRRPALLLQTGVFPGQVFGMSGTGVLTRLCRLITLSFSSHCNQIGQRAARVPRSGSTGPARRRRRRRARGGATPCGVLVDLVPIPK